mmetsp:Transcript_66116/g.154842  ORF Transcript_66116/g.154842 Transcript_66116/m.154842 type:complete len:223 (-) Transcript_66116:1194-1862(-)
MQAGQPIPRQGMAQLTALGKITAAPLHAVEVGHLHVSLGVLRLGHQVRGLVDQLRALRAQRLEDNLFPLGLVLSADLVHGLHGRVVEERRGFGEHDFDLFWVLVGIQHLQETVGGSEEERPVDEVLLHVFLLGHANLERVRGIPGVRHRTDCNTDAHSHGDVGACRPLAQDRHNDDDNGIYPRHLALQAQLLTHALREEGSQHHGDGEPLEGVQHHDQHNAG